MHRRSTCEDHVGVVAASGCDPSTCTAVQVGALNPYTEPWPTIPALGGRLASRAACDSI